MDTLRWRRGAAVACLVMVSACNWMLGIPDPSPFAADAGAADAADAVDAAVDDEPAADAAPAVQMPLSVTIAGNGVVRSEPSGILCGSTCGKSFDQGATVTLTAVAAENATFVAWTGNCATAATTCTVTMDQARAVTATFKAGYSLAITVDGTGTVTSKPAGIDCGAACRQGLDEGVKVELTAHRGTSAWFMGWSGDDDSCDDKKVTCTVTMTRDRAITARFLPLYKLTLTTQGSGKVTVTTSNGGTSLECKAGETCAQNYLAGTELTVAVTAADANFAFKGWTGDCAGRDACKLVMTAHRSAVATIVRTLALTLNDVGSGDGRVTIRSAGQADVACGMSTCVASFMEGTEVSLISNGTDWNRSFVGWDGACSGDHAVCTFTMTQAHSVTATFKLDYAVQVIAQTNHGGPGQVQVSQGGVTIGRCTSAQAPCTFRASPGTITMTALNEGCSVFSKWAGLDRADNPFTTEIPLVGESGAFVANGVFAGCQ